MIPGGTSRNSTSLRFFSAKAGLDSIFPGRTNMATHQDWSHVVGRFLELFFVPSTTLCNSSWGRWWYLIKQHFFWIISLFSDKSLLFGVHITLLGTVFVSMAQGLGTWPGLCRLAIPSLEMVDVSAPRLPQTGLVGTCGDHPPGYQDRTMGIPVNQWRDRGFWILTWVSHFLRGLVHQEVFCQVWMLKLSRTSWTN